MAETLTTDFAEEIKSGIPSDDWKSESALKAKPNGYVAIDVANLSLLATASAGELDFEAGLRTPVKKTFSRKGSAIGVAAGAGKSTPLVHVATDGEQGTVHLVPTTTARLVVSDGRSRRLASRRPAPWLDPRRVLVFFATLSSVGTLILLYFTLFMGNILDDDDSVW